MHGPINIRCVYHSSLLNFFQVFLNSFPLDPASYFQAPSNNIGLIQFKLETKIRIRIKKVQLHFYLLILIFLGSNQQA